jgi:hypothetical protein
MGSVSAASSSPNPGQIAQVPVDFNNVSSENAKALDTLRSWTATPSGKVELRFKQIDPATGLKVYEAKGGKSTVTLRATGFADAAKQADKLVAAKALAPRSAIWSDMRADPKARFNLPKKSSFLGVSPGTPPTARTAKPRAPETNTPQVASSRGGSSVKPTKEAKANLLPLTPKLSSGNSLNPAVVRNPFTLGPDTTTKPVDPTADLRKDQLPTPTTPADKSASKLTIDGAHVIVLRMRNGLQPVTAVLPSGEQLKFNAGTSDKGIQNSRIVRDKLARLEARPAQVKDESSGKLINKAFVYALTGGVASYNVLRSQGYSPKDALLLLPAGGARDTIQIALSGSKAGDTAPYLEVIQKGALGGVLVFGTNLAAGLVHRDAWPANGMHVAQIATAFTVNGFCVGTRELMKLTGNPPRDNPKGMDEWLMNVIPQAIATGAGVSVTQGGLVSAQELARGAGAFSPNARQTYMKAFLYPAVQYLIASYFTDGPKLGADEKNQLNDLQKSLAGVGGYVATDKLTSMIAKKPGGQFNGAQSAKWALGTAALGQVLDLYNSAQSLDKLDVRKLDSATLALEKINQLLEVPAVHIQSKVFGGGSYIRQLESDRDSIYQLHPTLRPSPNAKPQIKI